MTLLLASKAKQTRSRLIDAFSELASEGRYICRDFQQSYEVKARFSLIANITSHSLVSRKHLLSNTFIERCLVVYHVLTDEEMSEANLNRDQREAMTVEKFTACTSEIDVKVAREDLVRFDEFRQSPMVASLFSTGTTTDKKSCAGILSALLAIYSAFRLSRPGLMRNMVPRGFEVAEANG
jgi:hypothetical protein